MTKLKEDLEAIFNFVKKDDKVGEIGLMGQSFGTSVVIAFQKNVKCIVLTGTLAKPKELLSDHFEEGYNLEGISTRNRSDGSITKIEPLFWKDLGKYNLLKLVKEIKCPILFVQGSKDKSVPISEMELVFNNSINGKKVIIEGADHGLLPYRKKAYGVIVPWVVKKLISLN